MNLDGYLTPLREQFLSAAASQGDEARAVAERLVVPFESALRLTLLEALSGAAEEITSDLAPGTVDVRLRGGEPEFVVTPPPAPAAAEEAAPSAPASEPDDSPLTRINLRLGETLKGRIEEAAAAEKISVNAWLVRAAETAVSRPQWGLILPGTGPTPPPGSGQRFTGWVR
ncbi:toxin-antitoxin system HicB family antitoxin [Jongsikchunia kroppenstedtii]|uniref:toxin-antitoxin system HicB family antitoxin n=1 Tax=Jongsikchunia kroppenstedtii TaxID=1121721 RepID=UPI00037F0273|nr:toxin-antitoxin system HicB family antitoxin [Jongsikchunia kroppenstedtii]